MTHVVEFWRSRLAERDLVYWRDVTHSGRAIPPDSGTAAELATLLRVTVARYGRPQRRVRYTAHGRVVELRWRSATRFTFRPGSWQWTAR